MIFYQLFQTFIESFNGPDGKPSSKKLTTFLFVLLFVSLHISYLIYAFDKSDFSSIENVMIIELTFLGALFGIDVVRLFKFSKTDSKTIKKNEDKK
jgi:predicted Na+-dependent transporter